MRATQPTSSGIRSVRIASARARSALALLAILGCPLDRAAQGSPRDAVRIGVDVDIGDGTRLVWRREGSAATGELDGHAARATVTVAGGALAVEIAYHDSAVVDREIVRLHLSGPARVLGRDLHVATLGAPLRVDRGTPIVVLTPGVAVVGEQGFVAARYAEHDSTTVDVDLVLDDRDAGG
jgi:hypothetical protein